MESGRKAVRVQRYEGVLGAAVMDDLLSYAVAREADFRPAGVYEHGVRTTIVNSRSRDCMRLTGLGPFRTLLSDAVAARADDAAARLGLSEPGMEPVEVELCAYGDGGRFRRHMDVLPPPARVRVLTCVYYFSTTPRRFAGGALRVHPWPGQDAELIDIEPEPDTLVMFPSFLPHEVTPVVADTPEWRHRRFNLTCWLCRPKAEEAG